MENTIVRDAYVFGYPLVTMDMTRKHETNVRVPDDESLEDLGSRLQPAEGWSFRTVVLDQDLVLTPDKGDALITEDGLGNTFDRVGGAFRNYRP